MKFQTRSQAFCVSAGILLAGILPLWLYWPSFDQMAQLGRPENLPLHNVGPFEQWLVVITAFGVKPTYMLLSLLWIIWLWRRSAPDLVALRWGLIWFLAGETACAVNYVGFGGLSALTDYLHSYGMAVGFSFIAYAALEGMDVRLIKYSPAKDRCAALSLCRSCIKYAEVPCGLRRLFTLLIPALVVIALMLPSARIQAIGHRTKILDSVQDYLSPLWSQLFENQYCAGGSILLLLVSWAVLVFKRDEPVAMAKLFFAAAMGPLGFGLMRLFLRTAYASDLVWANVWEEVTELLFVIAVGFVLWVFRQSLFSIEHTTTAGQGEAAGTPA
jgi:hypothetical protein